MRGLIVSGSQAAAAKAAAKAASSLRAQLEHNVDTKRLACIYKQLSKMGPLDDTERSRTAHDLLADYRTMDRVKMRSLAEFRDLISCAAEIVTHDAMNFQVPWADKILNKEKTVEVRHYKAGPAYLDKDFWIAETHGECRAQYESQIVGVISFSESFVYRDFKQFRADEKHHGIPEGSKYDFDASKENHGWRICSARRIRPQPGPNPDPTDGQKGLIVTKDIPRLTLFLE